MRKVKLIACILLVSLLFCSFYGCSKKSPDDLTSKKAKTSSKIIDDIQDDKLEVSDTDDEIQTVFQDAQYSNAKKINFFKDGIFNFNIVYSASVKSDTLDIIKHSVFKQVRFISGKRPSYISDSENRNNGLHNIFIGSTNSALSKSALETIKSGKNYLMDYVIMVKNGDIAIQAYSDYALKNALNYFCENILVDEDSVIPENYLNHSKGTSITTNLKFNNIDVSSYIIQCETFPSSMVYKGCEELQSAIKGISDFEIPIMCGETLADNKILVQITNSNRNSYFISMRDHCLTVSAGHTYSLNAALHLLAMNLKAADKDSTLNIPNGYSYRGTYSENSMGSEGYKLVWSDEFDGDSLNTKYWTVSNYVSENNWRTPSAISVNNGSLVITSNKGKLPDGTDGYTAGEIQGKNIDFAYGFFEIKAKLPKGHGNWASFWTYARKSSKRMYNAEIDVLETMGFDNLIMSQLHSWWNAGTKVKGLDCNEAQIAAGHIQHLSRASNSIINHLGNYNSYKSNNGGFGENWHTFGCEWTPSYLKYYCDGKNYCTVNLESALTHPTYGYNISEYLMFTDGSPQNFVFGNFLGWIKNEVQVDDTTEYPSKYLIDYIHLYQIDTFGINNIAK